MVNETTIDLITASEIKKTYGISQTLLKKLEKKEIPVEDIRGSKNTKYYNRLDVEMWINSLKTF